MNKKEAAANLTHREYASTVALTIRALSTTAHMTQLTAGNNQVQVTISDPPTRAFRVKRQLTYYYRKLIFTIFLIFLFVKLIAVFPLKYAPLYIFTFLIVPNDKQYQPSFSWNCHHTDRLPPIIG